MSTQEPDNPAEMMQRYDAIRRRLRPPHPVVPAQRVGRALPPPAPSAPPPEEVRREVLGRMKIAAVAAGQKYRLVADMTPTARDIEAARLSQHARDVAHVRRIQREVAEAYGVPRDDILSERRQKRVAEARQYAMWRARYETHLSLPQIGRLFLRDHTTVIHAVQRVDAQQGREAPRE